jgi:hypothetical protein
VAHVRPRRRLRLPRGTLRGAGGSGPVRTPPAGHGDPDDVDPPRRTLPRRWVVKLEPHHAAARCLADDEVQRIAAWKADRALADRRAALLKEMAARTAARLDRLREAEGRLL